MLTPEEKFLIKTFGHVNDFLPEGLQNNSLTYRIEKE